MRYESGEVLHGVEQIDPRAYAINEALEHVVLVAFQLKRLDGLPELTVVGRAIGAVQRCWRDG